MPSVKTALKRVLGPPAYEESRIVRPLFRGQNQGVLLEVGAHVGDDCFLEFARRGWEIHAFEPDRKNRAALEASVSAMSSVTVVAKAVADKPGKLTLFRSAESSGISSLAAFTPGHEPAEEVEVISLSEYLEDGPNKVDFLKMDVEGYERQVMAGYPWRTHRPRAVLLEFEDAKTVPLGYRWSDLAEELSGRGYRVLVSEWFPIVRYGTAHRWRAIEPFPCELRDERAWGNLIAVEPADFDTAWRAARRAAWRLRPRLVVDRTLNRAKSGRAHKTNQPSP